MDDPTLTFAIPQSAPYRGRFAPSPTGELHWGSLFNAVAGFLQARSQNGKWLLRIDDIDQQRCRPQATDAIVYTLERFGLEWDESPYFQNQHVNDYHAVLQELDQKSWIYPCNCKRVSLKQHKLENPESADYPGFCRNKKIDRALPHALRLKTNHHPVQLFDPLSGPHSEHLSETTGDFIIYRRDQIISYHLASVVDDKLMDITEAVRGNDLIQSSLQQIHLQGLLNYATTQYLHTPLIVDSTNTKLSKQTGAKPVTDYPVTQTLFTLLIQLNQNPPQELAKESRETILNWAIANWDINNLKGCQEITLKESQTNQNDCSSIEI
ncbi:MAG: tRNA glutamyl-Q(34) synthetase GluQRS [Gammaproteobacteria bacterium]|nr:tRNA glutamyl-Q(34) synthetase GluQRS [Gammaproteobacteria bacterium]